MTAEERSRDGQGRRSRAEDERSRGVGGWSRAAEGRSRTDEGRSRADEGRSLVDEGRSRVDEERSRVDEGRSRVDVEKANVVPAGKRLQLVHFFVNVQTNFHKMVFPVIQVRALTVKQFTLLRQVPYILLELVVRCLKR